MRADEIAGAEQMLLTPGSRHDHMRSASRRLVVMAVLLAAMSWPVRGQQMPVAGRLPDPPRSDAPPRPTPRLPDGRPDLGNGKGVWNRRVVANLAGLGDPARSPVERIVDVPFLPWAKTLYEERRANLQKDDPEARCLPPGVPRMMATLFPFQIFQLPGRVLFIFEELYEYICQENNKDLPHLVGR